MVHALPPIVISETAGLRAHSLLRLGYTQSQASIDCPLCQRRYLLLLDDVVRPAEGERLTRLEQLATEYFREELLADHGTGHSQEQMSMRFASGSLLPEISFVKLASWRPCLAHS